MNYEGKIYRPWIEANSLLIQATLGCTNNSCTFCTMFDDKRFKRKKVEEVFADIEEARRLNPHVESIFLIDGNVMALKTDYLLEILEKINATFPELKKISLYSQYNDFNRKSLEELKQLKAAGVSMAYVGLESGDDEVLKQVDKRMTAAEAISGAQKAKEAGIRVLASFIFGLGGKHRSKEHIEETVRILNITQPEEIAPMALAVQPGSVLEQQVKSGEFVQATARQVWEEERYLLQHMNFETVYWGDHGNNIAPMRGLFPQHKEQFMANLQQQYELNGFDEEAVLETNPW